MAKKVDPLKQKAKRQKMIAIVGGVLLVALLAFQLPRTMKMLKGPSATSSSSSTPTATTPGSTPLAPPTLEGGSTATSAGGSGLAVDVSDDGVRDPSAPMPGDAGQLVSFSRFKSKDPFKQQVSDCPDTGCGVPVKVSAGSGAASSARRAATSAPSAVSSAPAVPAASSAATTSATVAPVTTALISVNDKAESVGVGKTFPAADPVFVLVALTKSSAKISIAGGSLEDGAGFVKLDKGKTVTLLNTADGTQYVLKLVSVS